MAFYYIKIIIKFQLETLLLYGLKVLYTIKLLLDMNKDNNIHSLTMPAERPGSLGIGLQLIPEGPSCTQR